MRQVIVVDDDAGFRALLREMFDSTAEFNVVGAAESGSQALDLIDNLRPDLLVSDIEMPEMDGLELVRRTTKRYPNTQSILVSANDESTCLDHARAEGAIAFIPKSRLSISSVEQALAAAS
jgi:DNA-binding NarL/FixJ family response regulator